jgi:hypothetical protein
MAKKKPARAKAAKAAARRSTRGGGPSAARRAKTGSPKRATARKKVTRKATRKSSRQLVARKAAARKATKATKGVKRTARAAKKVAVRKAVPKKAVAKKVAAKRAVAKSAVAKKVAARKVVAKAPVKMVPKARPATKPAVAAKPLTQAALPMPTAGAPKPKLAKAPDTRPKHPPTLDRARKTVGAEAEPHDIPSSLDMDRTASSARSGRIEMRERLKTHGPASPAITAGDVDADWESAESVGDEAPGGDNPTPDQDVVDDIGRALGVEYDDDEELKGGDEITDRDKHRWELDPGSSDDFDDR